MREKLRRFRARIGAYIACFVVIYGGFSASIGQLPSHIMGGHYAPYQVCYIAGMFFLFGAYLIHFKRITLLRGLLAGLAVGYISGLMAYLIAAGALDSKRFYHAITTTDPFIFIFVVLTTPLLLLGWLPGGVAGATTGAVIGLCEQRNPANKTT